MLDEDHHDPHGGFLPGPHAADPTLHEEELEELGTAHEPRSLARRVDDPDAHPQHLSHTELLARLSPKLVFHGYDPHHPLYEPSGPHHPRPETYGAKRQRGDFGEADLKQHPVHAEGYDPNDPHAEMSASFLQTGSENAAGPGGPGGPGGGGAGDAAPATNSRDVADNDYAGHNKFTFHTTKTGSNNNNELIISITGVKDSWCTISRHADLVGVFLSDSE